jgi:hypothetical protein
MNLYLAKAMTIFPSIPEIFKNPHIKANALLLAFG